MGSNHNQNDTCKETCKETAIIQRIRNRWGSQDPLLAAYEKKGQSAILIPLVEEDGECRLLFEERSHHLDRNAQPGEVCFPGGRVEKGETPRTAAIRETQEELLVSADQIEILAPLEGIPGPAGYPIWPFFGLLNDYKGTFSTDEVDHIFTVPFQWFLDNDPDRYVTKFVTVTPDDFPYDLIPGGRNYNWKPRKYDVYFYRHRPEIIWGITAKILKHTIDRYKREIIGE